MTGRERLQTICTHQRPDHLSWSALVDEHSLSGFPAALQGNGGLDFYRHVGCDILLLDGWGTPHGFRSPELRWPEEVQIVSRQEGDRQIQEWQTPWGTLTAVQQRYHPVRFPVDSPEALRIYLKMWEGAHYVAHDETPIVQAIDNLLGDDGIMTRFWGPSTIPLLLEMVMGTEQFYYLHADEPDLMDTLFTTMHERELEAFRILAAGPWEVVTLAENTSTYYIGPEIYRKYNMPHQRDFVDSMHAAGKTAILHMCGHVRDILPEIKETGLDGIHALTPPHIGNTPWELALDVLGEDLIIMGCLPAEIMFNLPLEEVGPALDRLITPRLAASSLVLIAFADGIIVPLERFQAIGDWYRRRFS